MIFYILLVWGRLWVHVSYHMMESKLCSLPWCSIVSIRSSIRPESLPIYIQNAVLRPHCLVLRLVRLCQWRRGVLCIRHQSRLRPVGCFSDNYTCFVSQCLHGMYESWFFFFYSMTYNVSMATLPSYVEKTPALDHGVVADASWATHCDGVEVVVVACSGGGDSGDMMVCGRRSSCKLNRND